MATGSGTKDDPWQLKTPPGTSDYTIYRDDAADPPQLVCQVGSTRLGYQARAIDDLHAWLKEQGDWVPLGAADESKERRAGHGRGLGPIRGQPGRWLVRRSQGLSRPFRDVHPAAARGARPRRGRAQPAQQPHAGDLTRAPLRRAVRSGQNRRRQSVHAEERSMPPEQPATPTVTQPVTDLTDPRAITLLTTEHWSLLTARSLAYNEAFTRGGMFLTFLSMTFVALALFSSAMSFGERLPHRCRRPARVRRRSRSGDLRPDCRRERG